MTKSVNQIRKLFLDYFANNGHEVVKSSPLVPVNDPSLLFTNAGMVQFKNYFTGIEEPKFKTAVTSQKCVRAGGKHNDLENVGYTARHHTFFEMLGNFSFGDYFKEDAIRYAYEFLTKELGLPHDKLIVTVYHTDEEAVVLWKKIGGFSDDKIIRISSSDNFWSMGATGPCGPCSEIFYDHGASIPGDLPGSENEGDRYIEIWNLVFMQYEVLDDGSRVELPKPAIDTGMGLERIAAIMQGLHNNFDIDLFSRLIFEIQNIVGENADEASCRVIADHLRSAAFLLADGVFPSNEGRGYVLRRIIRRAMRHAYQLGYKKPLLIQLLPRLQDEMGGHFSELDDASPIIEKLLLGEEERFGKTLERGLDLLNAEIEKLNGKKVLPGEIAFKLYDTYGFPVDLTSDILRPINLEIDMDGFASEMEIQKQRARENWQGSGASKEDKIWFELKEKFGDTKFTGYENLVDQGHIQALFKDGQLVDEVEEGGGVMLICNQTPFYAESGGQVGDFGSLGDDVNIFVVQDVKKFADGLFVHIGYVSKGSFKANQEVKLEVSSAVRGDVKSNHSATHLLHEALRRVLGKHVSQKGSLVSKELLRFDFTNSEGLTDVQLDEVEKIVNDMIRQNAEVKVREMSVDEAKEDGATMLFGEKYGEIVRVLTMGYDAKLDFFSKELCGGTHVERLGDIGVFKIVSEGSIASGVRRIEAFTGAKAFAYLSRNALNIKELSTVLKVAENDLVNQVVKLQLEQRRLTKELAKFQIHTVIDNLLLKKDASGGYVSIVEKIEGVSGKDLREVTSNLLAKNVDVIVIFAVLEGKVAVVSALSEKATLGNYNAAEIVKDVVLKLGGRGGGGKVKFAQGGASDISDIDAVLTGVKSTITSL